MKSCHCRSQAKVSCNQCGAALCGGGNCFRTHEKVCRPEPITADLHQLKGEEMRPHGGIMVKK